MKMFGCSKGVCKGWGSSESSFSDLCRKTGLYISCLLFLLLPRIVLAEITILISKAEEAHGIPKGLLSAIARVESEMRPYSVTVSGRSISPNSKAQAEKLVKRYLNKGHTNIDVGIMQVNYRWHNKQFSSIVEMLEPRRNIDYAARFLKKLYNRHGSWSMAVRHYHSNKVKHHRRYASKVLVAWLDR